MSMTFDDAKNAIRDARVTAERTQFMYREIARLIEGQLRASGLDSNTLTALKRELRDWNIHRGIWKDRK